MTYAVQVDENGQITLPAELRDHLDLGPDAELELEAREGVVILTKKPQPGLDIPPEDRQRRIHEAFAELRPAMRAAFVAEGWNSVQEYINDMRGW